MSATSKILLAFYGDDFTGSTDALEFLVRAGVRTMLFIEPPTAERLARYHGLQAVGVAGITRSMAPDVMEAELRPAFSTLRALGARHVHYKVCSTFDSSLTIGSIGRAIDVGAEIFGAKFVPLLVAAPALGRHCVFGNLFARMGIGSSGGIYRLDRHPAMSRHPITPADESDLRLHLARQTAKRIGLFDILNIVLPRGEARKALDDMLSTQPEVVLFDALHADQLARIGELLDAHANHGQPLFSVGSSGIEMALTEHWKDRNQLVPRTTWPVPGHADPLLVVSGSCSPVTERQIEWAVAKGYGEVALDTTRLAEVHDASVVIAGATSLATAHLKDGRNAIVHTSRGDADPRRAATAASLARRGVDGPALKALAAQLLGSALGNVVRAVVANTGVRRVLVSGGDTSSYAVRAMGIEAVDVIVPLAPGVPLLRAHAPGSPVDGVEMNFKGGQVGADDYFAIVARGEPWAGANSRL